MRRVRRCPVPTDARVKLSHVPGAPLACYQWGESKLDGHIIEGRNFSDKVLKNCVGGDNGCLALHVEYTINVSSPILPGVHNASAFEGQCADKGQTCDSAKKELERTLCLINPAHAHASECA